MVRSSPGADGRRPVCGHLEVVARLEGAQVVLVRRAPRLHHRRNQEGEQLRTEEIALLNANDREQRLDDAVDLELHVHCV